ncbi:hypothetical protein Emed_000002 [Eimeria media]
MDCDYSFVLAPRRVELPEDVEEDWRRRYLAFHTPGNNDYPFLGSAGPPRPLAARPRYRGPHLRLYVIRRPHGAHRVFGPRHPMTPAGRFLHYTFYHDRYPTSLRPRYRPAGNMLPGVAGMIGDDPRYSSSETESSSTASESDSEGSLPTESTTVGTDSLPSLASVDVPQVPVPPRRHPLPAPAVPPARRRRLGPRGAAEGPVLPVLREASPGEAEETAEVVIDEAEGQVAPADEGNSIASRVARRRRRS